MLTSGSSVSLGVEDSELGPNFSSQAGPGPRLGCLRPPKTWNQAVGGPPSQPPLVESQPPRQHAAPPAPPSPSSLSSRHVRGEMIHLEQLLDPMETWRGQPRGTPDKKLLEWSRIHLAGRGSCASGDAVKLVQRGGGATVTLPYCNLPTTAANRGILLLCVLDKLNSYGLRDHAPELRAATILHS